MVTVNDYRLFCTKRFYRKTRKGKDQTVFWMVILKTAPNDKTITDSVEKSKLFAGHFSNMERLYNEVILKVAGPFCENDFTWRGLFIYDCKTREDAEVFVKN